MKYCVTVACALLAKLMLVSCYSSKENMYGYNVDAGEVVTVFLPDGNWVVVDCRQNNQSISINQFAGYEVDFSRSTFETDLSELTDSVISEETLHYSRENGMPYMQIMTDYEEGKVRLWDINTSLVPQKEFELDNTK